MKTNTCDFCSKPTPISYSIKFFIDKNKQLTLGGSDHDYPLCQSCWNNIADHALGHSDILEKERCIRLNLE